jgi:hypothetical protein
MLRSFPSSRYRDLDRQRPPMHTAVMDTAKESIPYERKVALRSSARARTRVKTLKRLVALFMDVTFAVVASARAVVLEHTQRSSAGQRNGRRRIGFQR